MFYRLGFFLRQQRIGHAAFDTGNRHDIAARQVAAHRNSATAHGDLGFASGECLHGGDAAFDQHYVDAQAMLLEDLGFLGEPVRRHIGGQRAVGGFEAGELGVGAASNDGARK